jgi:hypothetical protein
MPGPRNESPGAAEGGLATSGRLVDRSGERSAPVELAEAIADSWNRHGIDYVVTHGLERYPDGPPGRDLDVLVSASARALAVRIAGAVCYRSGWAFSVARREFGRSLVAVRRPGRLEVLAIDLSSELRWGPVVVVGCPEPHARKGPFKIDPWASFAKRILFPLLVGVTRRLQERPRELALTRQEREAAARGLGSLLGSALGQSVLGAIDAGDPAALGALSSRVRRKLLVLGVLGSPFQSAAASLSWLRSELCHLLPRRCAPVVALVGPDGVGKSTVIDHVKRQLEGKAPFAGVVLRHWRPNLLPQLAQLNPFRRREARADNRPRRVAGPFGMARLMYYFLDYALGGWLMDARCSEQITVVLYDRCALDMVVDPVRFGLRSGRGAMLLWRLCRKPDLVILLADDAARVHSRKDELTIEEVRRQLRRWRELLRTGAVGAVLWVDGGPEEIAQRVKDLVVETFLRINEGNEAREAVRRELLDDAERELTSERDTAGERPESARPGNERGRGAEFSIVPGRSRPRLLIPVGRSMQEAGSLRLYRPQTLLARTATTALRVGLRLGAAGVLLSDRVVVDGNQERPDSQGPAVTLLDHLREVFPGDGVAFALSLGTPGRHHKQTILAMDPAGKAIAYVKIGRTGDTVRLLRNEEEVCRALGTSGLKGVPRVLHAGFWNGRYLVAFAASPSASGQSSTGMTSRHVEFLVELYRVHCTSAASAWSEYLGGLRSRIERLATRGFTFYARLLEEALLGCERPGAAGVTLCMSHGDFTPWNVEVNRDGLFVWDWEYGRSAAPVGWDLFHFIVQRGVLIGHRPPPRLYRAVTERGPTRRVIETYFGSVGVDSRLIEASFTLYLVDILSRYLWRDGEALTAESRTLVRSWAVMLTLGAPRLARDG